MQSKPTILFILAHPDDESFLPAGTIAKYARQGVRVIHICATRGESGHYRGTKHQIAPDALKMIRCQELEHACKILGVADYFVLDYPDGHLTDLAPAEPIRHLVTFIRREKPDLVITFDVTGITHHTDHTTIHYWVTEAFQMAGNPDYEAGGEEPFTPAKLYYLTVPSHHLDSISDAGIMKKYIDGKISTAINVQSCMEEKRKAIECHHSQCHSIQKIFKFAGGADELDDHEYYILARCNLSDYSYEVFENDLLSGIIPK